MKKLFVVTTVLLVAAAITLAFVGCEPKSDPVAAEASYINIKINPEVEMTASADGIITSFSAVNEDAEVILSDIDLVGMSAEEAVEKVVDLATEAGYIDEESADNEVTVGVIEGDEARTESELENKIRGRIRQYFDNHGINGTVSKETLDQYAEQAASLGVSVGKMKMILRALDMNPELDINILKEIEMKDLIALLKESANHGIGSTLQDEFNTQKTALREKYARMFELEDLIADLQTQIAAAEDETQKADLESQLATLQSEYDTLKAAYEAERQALNQTMQEERTELREQRKQERQEKIAEHRKNKNEENTKGAQNNEKGNGTQNNGKGNGKNA